MKFEITKSSVQTPRTGLVKFYMVNEKHELLVSYSIESRKISSIINVKTGRLLTSDKIWVPATNAMNLFMADFLRDEAEAFNDGFDANLSYRQRFEDEHTIPADAVVGSMNIGGAVVTSGVKYEVPEGTRVTPIVDSGEHVMPQAEFDKLLARANSRRAVHYLPKEAKVTIDGVPLNMNNIARSDASYLSQATRAALYTILNVARDKLQSARNPKKMAKRVRVDIDLAAAALVKTIRHPAEVVALSKLVNSTDTKSHAGLLNAIGTVLDKLHG